MLAGIRSESRSLITILISEYDILLQLCEDGQMRKVLRRKREREKEYLNNQKIRYR